MIYLIFFKTYILLIVASVVVAALAAIPGAIILKKLGLSKYWGLLLFLILVAAPFIAVPVASYLTALFVTSPSAPTVVGVLKLIEWTPCLIFLWVIALRGAPKDAARA